MLALLSTIQHQCSPLYIYHSAIVVIGHSEQKACKASHWHQVTIEITCCAHSTIACLCHIHIGAILSTHSVCGASHIQWPHQLRGCHTITTFTCQAAVQKNETACSDVIVLFGLHIWKSFTCGRRVSKHLLCRLVSKRLYGVGKHGHWLQISRIWKLLFMLLTLVAWIIDYAAHCKIQP